MLFIEGDVIENRYRIDSYIGKGGMSEVYLGVDTKLKKQVALKVLTKIDDNNPITFQRFNREIEIMSKVSHPNIVEIIDYFLTKPYIIVLEYVKGDLLKQIIKKRAPFLLKEVIMITKQLLSAMVELENHNIIHRDLKPQNVIVTSSGLIKILDFGISIFSEDAKLSKDESIVGSVQYMSPETVKNSNITIRSDIYSMGIILYEMLTGIVPFHSSDSIKVAIMHIKNTVPSIKKSSDSFHDDLDFIIRKATAKDPSDRYQTFKEFQNDFLSFTSFVSKNKMDIHKMKEKSIFKKNLREKLKYKLKSFFRLG